MQRRNVYGLLRGPFNLRTSVMDLLLRCRHGRSRWKRLRSNFCRNGRCWSLDDHCLSGFRRARSGRRSGNINNPRTGLSLGTSAKYHRNAASYCFPVQSILILSPWHGSPGAFASAFAPPGDAACFDRRIPPPLRPGISAAKPGARQRGLGGLVRATPPTGYTSHSLFFVFLNSCRGLPRHKLQPRQLE